MIGFFKQCIEKYLGVARSNGYTPQLKPDAFPSVDDHQIPPEEFEQEGKLSKDASNMVMEILYGARFVRLINPGP